MALESGARLGDYEILAPIGSGGMGEVYRARDHRLGRLVALKVLPSYVADDEDRRARFEREARAVAALSHSNIVAIYEFGRRDGLDFAVMELLEGESLRDRLAARPLPVRKAMEYGGQIAQGLAAAHDKGIVHRDLKPENVFLTSGGQVKILDFGLARNEQVSEAGQTQTRDTDPGRVLGTVGYMSPEQVRGAFVDHRSDIFSFGCVLYEMLTGKRAFKRDTAAETMSAVLRDEPPEAPTESGPLSPAIDRIVRHCLEKAPAERFQSARDLAFDLQAVLAGTVVTDPRGGRPPDAGRGLSLGRGVAASAVAALLALAVGYALGRRTTALKPEKEPQFARLTYNRGTIHTARFTPDGKTVVYSAAWEGQPIRLFLTRPGGRETTPISLPDASLFSISPSGELAISLGHAFFGWMGAGTLARTQILGGAVRPVSEDIREADWGPDGTTLAVVRRVNGHERLEYPLGTVLYETLGYISHMRFSPRGDEIAFADHPIYADDFGSLAVIDLKGNKKTLTDSYSTLRGVAWSPSGSEVWYTATGGSQPQGLRAVDLQGHQRLVLAGISQSILFDISRDGQVLLGRETPLRQVEALVAGRDHPMNVSLNREQTFGRFISADGQAILFTDQYLKGYETFLARSDGSPPISLGEGDGFGMSQDGKWVVALTPEAMPRILIHPTGPGSSREVPNPQHILVGAIRFLNDPKKLVGVGATQSKPQHAYVFDVDTGAAQPFGPDGVLANTALFHLPLSPEGDRVLLRDEATRCRIARVDGSSTSEPLPNLEGETPYEWSEDGRALLVAHREGTSWHVMRYDIATGKKSPVTTVAPVDPAGLRLTGLTLSPNGRYWVHSYSVLLTDLYLAQDLH
jgi:Tol biopolymer transport system component